MFLPPNAPQSIEFCCNICGTKNEMVLHTSHREGSSCTNCGSSPRFRGLMYILSMGLYNKFFKVPDFPADKSIRGVGMSEWPGYASQLQQTFDFQNTYFHQEPKLDITSPEPMPFSDLDFVISTEVFEHIHLPLEQAYSNLFSMLKPGGTLVFSAPYSSSDQTIEHFPELADYQLISAAGDWALVNRTKDGVWQLYDNLVFHGGPGSVLEMRIFCEKDLISGLAKAGFEDIQVYSQPIFDIGYYWAAVAERPLLDDAFLGYLISAKRPMA